MEKNNEFGLYYDQDKTAQAVRFSVDSLLKAITLHPSKLRVYNLELGVPTEIVKEGHVKVEKYLNKKTAPNDAAYKNFSYDTLAT